MCRTSGMDSISLLTNSPRGLLNAQLQNATAGPPEPNGKTIGQKAAQRGDPSAVAWVKFGSWEVAQVLRRKQVYFLFQNLKNPPFLGVERKTGTFLISRETGAF